MRFSTFACVCWIALSVAGCRTAPSYPVPGTQWTVASTIDANPPMEIAVVPVANQGADGRLPLDVLRESLCDGLIASAYSPLDTRYVDSQAPAVLEQPGSEQAAAPATLEAGYGAQLEASVKPDAWLRVSLNQSDDQLFSATGAFFLSGRAELLRGDGSEVLWGADVVRRLELGPTRGLRLGDGTFLQQAAQQYAAEIVKLLPVRKAALAPKAL
jgi:hypothetical protein